LDSDRSSHRQPFRNIADHLYRSGRDDHRISHDDSIELRHTDGEADQIHEPALAQADRSRARRVSTIRRLRGTGISARAEQGCDLDHIANDIGMSRQNVDHYMCFRDRMKVGADSQKRFVWRPARTRPRTPARLYERSNSPSLQNFWPRLQKLS
jgi:hypothetical protein